MQLTNLRLAPLFPLVLAIALSATSAVAQQDQTPKRGFQAGGSYALSDIETVNTGNGNLILSIPLASLPAGRGTAPGASLRLLYNSKMFDSRVARHSQGLPEDPGGGCISPSGLPVPCDEVRFRSWKERYTFSGANSYHLVSNPYRQKTAENPNIDKLSADIIHDSRHSEQLERGLTYNNENAIPMEREASMFTVQVI